MVILRDSTLQHQFKGHEQNLLQDFPSTPCQTERRLRPFKDSDGEFILKGDYSKPEPSAMADDKTAEEAMAPTCPPKDSPANADAHEPTAAPPRSKRKLLKTGSKWFNKSFDQSSLQQPTENPRPMRRQNSVTDFFQNMLSKSKAHLQDIFTSKREKQQKQKSSLRGDGVSPQLEMQKSETIGADGGISQISDPQFHADVKISTMHSSCPSIGGGCGDTNDPRRSNPRISFDPDPCASTRRTSSHSSPSTAANVFVTTRSEDGDPLDMFSSQHRPIVKNPSPHFMTGHDTYQASISPSHLPSPSPTRRKSMQSPLISPIRYRTPKIITLPSLDSPDSADDEGRVTRKVSSAPAGRPSVCSAHSFLETEDSSSRSKRSLVKSNSDTFAKLTSDPQPLAKASSDGNCFRKCSPSSSLAASMTSNGNVMISVTDYLFLGSIEAAYNEPLLCKYGISSLIDMTNTSPGLVPASKKSDCPCACAHQTHFRSKLNIGVDDIEWENLEQYFGEINAFINGARRMGRRVLVFSYMGQSRAPAAVIQHLMQHFKMPYRDAINIVRAKRPQVKLNSGFVKALCRLEKRLGLQETDSALAVREATRRAESPRVSCGSVEELETLAVPPVVRGAWLEC